MGPSQRTGSLEGLREGNRLRVLDALRSRGAVSRADIARQTGLSRTTVSSLVSDLQEAGLVIEREEAGAPAGAQGGRPPVLLALDRSVGTIIGIDFGHRHLRVAAADLSFAVLAEADLEIDVDASAARGLRAAVALVEGVLEEAGVERERVLGVAMGLPGPIDRATGMVRSGAILPGWVGLDPAAELGARLGLPVHLENDANVGALGEVTFGAGAGRRGRRLPAPVGRHRLRPRARRPPVPRRPAASPARSATCWSTPTGRSAAAATAAAWRPSCRAPPWSSCCAARTAR